VLAEMERIGAPALARARGQQLRDVLGTVAGVDAVRGMGLLLAVELQDADARVVAAELLRRGLVVNAVTPTALRLAPPITVTDAEITEAASLLAAVLTGSEESS
jgi:acetylornithine/succinyldiaminopimelate/putrescine aminotransferase